MKNRLIATIGIGTALLGTGALVTNAYGLQPQPTSGNKRGIRMERREKHPEIMRAMRNLEQAKRNLQNGAHDFGGHRAKALEHTEQALQECREALKFDKR